TAAAEAELAVAPELVANSMSEYLRAAWARVRAGQSGVLPVVGGLLLITILFQALNSNFLTAGNMVNLLIQGAVYMLLAMGEVFALLLGEIDLSIGNLGPVASWIVMAAIVAVFAARTWRREERRRDSGLVAPPRSLTVLKVAAAAAAGVVVVVICNTNRGRLVAIRGLPWVVL